MANCYETQNAQFVCETCPDEECIDVDRLRFIDGGQGHASPTHNSLHFSDVPVSNKEEDTVDKDQSALNEKNKRISLVSHRKLLFENIAGKEMNMASLTDDAKATKAAAKKTNDSASDIMSHSQIIDMSSKSIDDVIESSNSNIQKLKEFADVQLKLSNDKNLTISSQDRVGEENHHFDQNHLERSDSHVYNLTNESNMPEGKPSITVQKTENSSKITLSPVIANVNNLYDNSDDLNSFEKTGLKSSDDSLLSNDEGINSFNSTNSCKSNSDVVLSLETVDLNDPQPDTSLVYSEINDTANDITEMNNDSDNSLVLNEIHSSEFGQVTDENRSTNVTPKLEIEPVDQNTTSNFDNVTNEKSINQVMKDLQENTISAPSNDVRDTELALPQSDIAFNSTDCKTETKRTDEEEGALLKVKEGQSESTLSTTSVIVDSAVISGEQETSLSKTKSYPKGLNPFGDDDDEEEMVIDKISVIEHKESNNPFGSDTEEETEQDSLVKKPVPKPRTSIAPKNSYNPFPSDDEIPGLEDDNLTPPPTPLARKIKPEEPPSPAVSHRSKHSRQGSTSSIGSTVSTSTLSHKKKPAPRPPSVLSPKYRKSKPAPPPPKSPTSPASPPTSTLSSLSPPSSPQSLNKADKESANRLQQTEGPVFEPHKSVYGQWKRKKGPAPQRPIPIKRQVKEPMCLNQIKQELSDIEIKQQELERQGVKLEQSIRDGATDPNTTPAVEDMMSQLFELVNEKNELLKRQAELTYLRRQHNLEQEHADLEYRIRCLMLCPEANKTDSDKELEEQLIQRLVEVVERRNEIVENLEVDRQKDLEEQKSAPSLELHSLGSASDSGPASLDKTLRKKEKKQKKEKKGKKNAIDADKDIDTSESPNKKSGKYNWFGTLRRLPKKL